MIEISRDGGLYRVTVREECLAPTEAVYDVLAALPEPREGRVFRTRSIRTAFENAVEEAKLDDLHFHDLRHHFASWFVMRGGSLQALKEILGHADLKMTLKYAHLAPHYLRDEIAKTERPAQAVSEITQKITQEPAANVVAVEVSRNSS